MNGRDESFSVSIFREATRKKVDEIVPFTEGGGGERGKGRETQLSAILSGGKFGFSRKQDERDALTSSTKKRRLI